MSDTIKTNVGAIIFLAIGVGMSIMVLIMTGALSGSTYALVEDDLTEIGAETYSGTFVADNRTYVSMGHTLIQESTFTCVNATGVSKTANFTFNYTNGTAKLGTALPNSSLNGTTFTVGYTYDTSTRGKAVRDNITGGIVSTFEALGQTGNYLPTIVLAVVIFIVLGMVLGLVGYTTKKGGGGIGGAL